MLGLVILQNASFTLVSRARNSSSLMYHTLASVLSNGIWLLVIRQVVINLDSWMLMVTYLVGAVVGSVSMHYVAMKYFEKPKDSKKKEVAILKERLRFTREMKEIFVKGQDFNTAAIIRDHERILTERLEETNNENNSN